jgi:hypothetical protein
MARLPIPGGDVGTWGDVLNEFLLVEHDADGTLKTSGSLADKQPLDADLTDISALSPTNDDVLQRKSGAWTNRTPAQLKTDLSLTKSDVGLSNVDNTSDANKPISTATQTALDSKASTSHASTHIPGGSDAINFTTVNPTGTLAGRPAASSANAGLLYFASNDNGGTLYRSDGATWTKVSAGATEASGQILASSVLATTISASNYGTLSANGADTGLAITVTGTGRPIMIEYGGIVQIGRNSQSTTSFARFVAALVDSTDVTTQIDCMQIMVQLNITTQQHTPYKVYLDSNLANGQSRTYKVYAYMSNGSSSVNGSYVLYGRDFAVDWVLMARQG